VALARAVWLVRAPARGADAVTPAPA
jgi:hypothetical protein